MVINVALHLHSSINNPNTCLFLNLLIVGQNWLQCTLHGSAYQSADADLTVLMLVCMLSAVKQILALHRLITINYLIMRIAFLHKTTHICIFYTLLAGAPHNPAFRREVETITHFKSSKICNYKI